MEEGNWPAQHALGATLPRIVPTPVQLASRILQQGGHYLPEFCLICVSILFMYKGHLVMCFSRFEMAHWPNPCKIDRLGLHYAHRTQKYTRYAAQHQDPPRGKTIMRQNEGKNQDSKQTVIYVNMMGLS